jgi:ubiquitin C-terminal hydrolase
MSTNNTLIDNNEKTEELQNIEPINFGMSKFKNIKGITCYMNSILHILQQIPLFTEWITQVKFREVLIKKINYQIEKENLEDNYDTRERIIQKYVIFELFRLFKKSMENDDSAITPTSFKKIIGCKNDMWNEHNHQDSQEFFTFLISQLEEEVGIKTEFIPGFNFKDDQIHLSFDESINNLMANNSWMRFQSREYSPLINLFNGLIETNRKCICCESKITRYEPYITLGLSIPIKTKRDITKSFDIYECIDHLIKEEQLDEDNKMNCEMCGLKNQGHTKSLLWKTPKILVFHIKRFLVNPFGIPTQKLNNNVIYPIKDLDLTRYFNPASPYKVNSKYDLIGINLHQSFGHGENINHGHYTSIVKNMINNNWYLYNDSNSLIMAKSKQDLQSSNACLLFYYCHN